MHPRLPRTRPLARALALLLATVAIGRLPLGPAPAAVQAKETANLVAAPKNLADLKTIEDRVKRVVQKVLPAIVAVRVGASQGSGVVVSKDGYVMTAGHVVGKPGQDVLFTFSDGKTAKGKTLGMFKTADAGLMKITDPGEWAHVEKAEAGAIDVGMWCVAVGHPFGYMAERPPVVRTGRVLLVSERAVQTDCPLVAGDSGGPLFDLDGRVIGINSRIGGLTTMNFHVPIDIFHTHWQRLAKGDAWELSLPRKDSDGVKAAFRQVVDQAGKCVVRVKCDGKDALLGTIVGPDGWILTKASELKGKIACHFRDGKELEAQVVGIDKTFDLAMLKVEAAGLPPIDWSDGEGETVGQWVAVPGLADTPLTVGTVSVPRRKIPPPSGVLGVQIGPGDGGARITRVLPRSPAQKAGLKDGDVITHVDGTASPDQKELVTLIKKHRPGEVVKLTVKRDDKTLEISVKLAVISTPATKKRELQNLSGVGISKRRDDFPVVLQHDTVLKPTDCGGPLVDLSGKVIGVNIARGGRTETYSVPSDVLLGLMYDLMSGRLAPPKPEPEKKPEPKQPKPQIQPKADQKPEPDKKPGAKTQPEPEKKAEPPAKPEPEKKPEPKPPEPETQPKREQKPEPDKKPGAKTQPKPEKKAEPPAKPEADKKPEPKPRKPEEQPAPDKKPEEKPEPKPEAKAKPEPQAKPALEGPKPEPPKPKAEKKPEPPAK